MQKRVLLFLLFFFSFGICYSQSPNWLWAKGEGGIGRDDGMAIAIDSSGNVYTTGIFSSTADFDPCPGFFNLVSNGQTDIFILKLDSSGNFVWAKQIGGATYDAGESLAIDSIGNVYITGAFSGTVDFDPGAGVFNLTSDSSAKYED